MIYKALRYIRLFHMLTQKQVAEKIKISKSFLCEIEAGKKKVTIELLQEYALTFNIPVSSIIYFSEILYSNTFTNKNPKNTKLKKIIDWALSKEEK